MSTISLENSLEEDLYENPNTNNAFHIDIWNVRIRQALAPIDILHSLLTDDDAPKFLKPRLKGVSHLSQPVPNFEMSEEYLKGEIGIAFSTYMGQMIVVAITYAELLIKDFYRCMFHAYPERMNSFLASDGKGKATINLNELLSAPSKEKLVQNLVERAARRVASQRIDKTVEKLVNDNRIELTMSLVKDLREMSEKRNQIVHEGLSEELTLTQVHNAYGVVLYLLYLLAEVAEKDNIPSVDHTNFLADSRRKIKDKEDNDIGAAGNEPPK